MAEERVRRRLAAILAADVVGYSRLMGLDEIGTLDRLKALRRDLIDPKIDRYGGRLVKTTGDGLLAEFPSAVDAVTYAVDLQSGLAARNADLPEGHRISLRVGINVGDIISDADGDIFGDGVNVAARLESLAAPGGIAISARVHEHVGGRLDPAFDVAFEDAGEISLKNIAQPVRVYRVRIGGASADTVAGGALPAQADSGDRPSIAVLAFDNMSGDPEQAYFADGIAEDIITDLSQVSGLFVIARNSSFAYRGTSPDLRKVGRELGVRYVLEGSVRRAGNRVRINAQMIDSATGGHVWADRYDRDLSDIFEVQDEVTRTIVEALKVALTPTEEVRRRERRKVDPAAYDLLIRGRDRLLRFTEDDLAAGQELLEQAVEIDPGLAAGFAWLSLTFGTQYLNRWSGADSGHLDRAIAFAEQACRTDPDEPQGYHALAIANLWRANYETSEVSARKAVELNPNFAGGYSALGQVLDLTGRHEQAIEAADRVLALDPYYDVGLQLRGRALFALGRDEEATISFRRRLDRIPNSDMSRLYLAAIAGLSGRVDEARGLWQQIMEIDPGFSLDRVRRNLRYTVPEPLERLEEGLRRALLL